MHPHPGEPLRRHGITDHRIRHENGIGRIGKKPHPIICIDTALLRKCVERRCHLFAPAPPGAKYASIETVPAPSPSEA